MNGPFGSGWEEGKYQVETVLDQWYDPESIYYKVLTDDGNVYILRIGIGGRVTPPPQSL